MGTESGAAPEPGSLLHNMTAAIRLVQITDTHLLDAPDGDLRGVVEDALQKTRRVRCSIGSFHSVGAIVDGTSLLATVPELVAKQIRLTRPHLRIAELPFELTTTGLELLWSVADDDDPAGRFLREEIVRATEAAQG